ncbi:hypothetical protein SARC_13854 [Sphaeroforma arctica JP610]|uniref:Uncharacterized protein n=1 Tax=Sphaeroforma arctica JP610 TaxID=667725 RepID=A0A0L0FAR1_9EUKA|nr:hypothetical protein SARC_13854 [Sphaeroforma arctica JP610]KNC73586.1 hypothetical protein SARC_13854 [Sphaeroforma arctica JP610]|eukprot:XP_014147488.1 hypothetical protein SARC_13854 [Sphaeroforma arctica JP610]
MSANDLIDMRIITHISGLRSMPKSKRLKCKIYSDEMEVYVFKLGWLPKGFQYKKTGVEVRTTAQKWKPPAVPFDTAPCCNS